MRSEQINELISALAKAQGEMSAASKDCNNPFFKSKYADLNSIWMACRDPLSKNGLAVTQTTVESGDGLYLETLLGHSSGQYIISRMPIRVKSDGKTNELQVLGSCLTYLRRYALAAIVGVAPNEDDDGNSGNGYQANKHEPHQENQQITIINPIQAKEIANILSQISPDNRELFNNYLKQNNIASISKIPAAWYPQIMRTLDSQKLEWRKKVDESATAIK